MENKTGTFCLTRREQTYRHRRKPFKSGTSNCLIERKTSRFLRMPTDAVPLYRDLFALIATQPNQMHWIIQVVLYANSLNAGESRRTLMIFELGRWFSCENSKNFLFQWTFIWKFNFSFFFRSNCWSIDLGHLAIAKTVLKKLLNIADDSNEFESSTPQYIDPTTDATTDATTIELHGASMET